MRISLMGFFFIAAMVALHVYLYWSVYRVLGRGAWQWPVLAFMFACLAASLLARVLADSGLSGLAHLWTGFVLMTTMWLGVRDAAHLLALGADACLGSGLAARLLPARTIPVAFAVGLSALGYSLWEARHPRVREIAIPTARLPAGTNRIRIVAISDMHLTRRTSADWLEKVVGLVNARKPDLVASLGDLVDDDTAAIGPGAAATLARLEARAGKFAVIGNHDVYGNLEESLDYTERSGFTVLRGAATDAGGICVVGVDDLMIKDRVGAAEALAGADPDKFILLLSHRPEAPKETAGKFDLQLSGHTHGGQIWPVGVVTRWLDGIGYGYRQGLNEVAPPAGAYGRRSLLYLSNGTGFFGPPVRFFAPPEITVVDLVK